MAAKGRKRPTERKGFSAEIRKISLYSENKRKTETKRYEQQRERTEQRVSREGKVVTAGIVRLSHTRGM